MGPSIKYVTLSLANFYPLPPVTLRHTSRDPSPESTSHISDPPIFRRPSTKNPDKSPLVQILSQLLAGFLSGGVLSGVFCLEGFVRGGFCPFPFCQNTTRTKAPLYKFCLNCSRGFCPGGFVRGLLPGRFCPGWFLSISVLSEYICYIRKLNITLNFMFRMCGKKNV